MWRGIAAVLTPIEIGAAVMLAHSHPWITGGLTALATFSIMLIGDNYRAETQDPKR